MLTRLNLLCVLLASSSLDMVGSLPEPEGEIPHWLKPNPINILMVDSPPYFGTDLAQKVVTRLGDTAFLRCKVFNLGNKMVSWLRADKLEIISSGLYTFIRDPRYSAEYMEEENTWVLRITKVEYEDSAVFDCQVNTDPVMMYPVSLKVVKPDHAQFVNDAPLHVPETSVTIVGGPHNHVKVGDALNLTCVVTNPPPHQGEVQWLVNDHLVSPRQGLSILSETSPSRSSSSLIIHEVHMRDSGLYRCAPGGTDHALQFVQIIAGLNHDEHLIPSHMVIPLVSLLIISFLLIILGVLTAMAATTDVSESCSSEVRQV